MTWSKTWSGGTGAVVVAPARLGVSDAGASARGFTFDTTVGAAVFDTLLNASALAAPNPRAIKSLRRWGEKNSSSSVTVCRLGAGRNGREARPGRRDHRAR